MNDLAIPKPSFEGCTAGTVGPPISVVEAVTRSQDLATAVRETETVDLSAALGRILSRTVTSPSTLPLFPNAAMDGYAVSAGDLTGPGPWELPVVARLAAGCTDIPDHRPNTAIRIMTGAPVPFGADTVVMQEKCARMGNTVRILERPALGKHVRLPGEDLAVGTAIAESGQELTARHAALLAASGIAEVDILRRIKVGLVSTGAELREPGTDLAPGQIYNSNRYYLRARLTRSWIEIEDFGVVADDLACTKAVLRKAAETCDVVISTGGVSAGEEDHVRNALRDRGADLRVLKVNMRPGKPVTVGRIGEALYFGLPGNPFACAMTFMHIAWPAIRRTGGVANDDDEAFQGIADFSYSGKLGKTEFLPVTWSAQDVYGRPIVHRLGRGASASLHPYALAKAIAKIGPADPNVCEGDSLSLLPVDF